MAIVNAKTLPSGLKPVCDPGPGSQQARCKDRKQPRQGSSRAYEQEAFSAQQLAEYTYPSGANRHAQAEFMLANRVTRLHHHGNIGARDEQDKRNQTHQDCHRNAVSLVVATDTACRDKFQQRLPFPRIDLSDGLLDDRAERAGECLLGLRRRNPRAKSRHHAKVPPLRENRCIITDSAGSPHAFNSGRFWRGIQKSVAVAGSIPLKPCAVIPMTANGIPFDVNGLAQDAGVARETPCPVVIAEDDDGRVVSFIFKCETTAAFHLHTQA